MTPPTASPAETGDARRITLRLLDELFGAVGDRQAGFRLWDGALWPGAGPRPVTVVLQHPGALRAMLLPGHELGLATVHVGFGPRLRARAAQRLPGAAGQAGRGRRQWAAADA